MALSAAQINVATAIQEISGPESVKQLLLTALPQAYGTNVHHFQKEVAAMLRKSLEDARVAAGEAQTASARRMKEAQSLLETLQAGVESNAGAEEAAQVSLKETVAAVEKAHAVVRQEEAACEEAASMKALATESQRKLEAAKAEVESIQTGSFRMLLDGGWEDEEVRDACIDAVCSYLSTESADVVLMAALPKALALRPADHGTFDKLVVDEALRLLSEKVNECNAKLEQEADALEDITAEHLGVWAIADVARDKEVVANEEFDKANAALQNATKSKKLALSEATEQQALLETIASEASAMHSKVQTIDVALSSLSKLEAGEIIDKENVDKENAMVVDEESKINVMPEAQMPVAVA
jgi:hypothetical protein